MKSYQEQCYKSCNNDAKVEGKRRYNNKPEVWGHFYNPDGTLKHQKKKKVSLWGRSKKPYNDMPKSVLASMHRVTIVTVPKVQKQAIPVQVTATQIKMLNGRVVDFKILKYPKGCNRKEYNRIWMNNCRMKKRIEELQDKYGIKVKL